MKLILALFTAIDRYLDQKCSDVIQQKPTVAMLTELVTHHLKTK